MKIRLVCSLPAFENVELAAAVEAWCEVLYPVVPVNRLNDCYLRAIRNRESTFALAATELLTAWQVINTEEARERQKSQPCRLCFGYGYGKVYDRATDTEIVKECPHCHGKAQTAIAKTQ